ncbi:MAG TPA: PAS-domain containing protein [Burkholderiaceae bacterium]|nr:PAS-domain containing protein [Burkholderiaceae bacterium]
MAHDDLRGSERDEQQLRESAARHEFVMRAINEGVYDWDIVNDSIYYSERVFLVLGMTPAILRTPADWRARIHPDDRPRYDAALVAHFKGETERFECDYRYRARDGAWRWARQHGVAMRNGQGRAIRLLGSTGDITELKERERELAAQKAILEATLENIDQGITMVDKDLRTIALNRRFFELLDLPAERFGRGFHMEEAFRFNAERGEYGPGDVEEQVRQRVALASRFEPHAFERRRPNGRVIAIHGKPLPGGGFVSTYTDVTEQRRAEEAVRQSEERYALATRAAVAWIYEWNVATGALYLSERPATFFRIPSGEVSADEWAARVHADDLPAYRQAMVDHFKGRMPQLEREYRVRDADGETRWVLERGVGIRDATGRVIKVVGALSDVTRRKRAEIALREARDQAEEALEQQTATAEILASISASIAETQPVFDAIVRNLLRLFGTRFVVVQLLRGDRIELAAVHGEPGFERLFARYPQPLDDRTAGGRVMRSGRVLHLAPVLGNPETPPLTCEFARDFGFDALLAAPLMRDETVIGAIVTARRDAVPFDPRQVALIKTFADQAVIAIENARLFKELEARNRELSAALEQQTATSEILRVISRSPIDVQPVFDAIAAAALSLCRARTASVLTFDGRLLHLAARAMAKPDAMEAVRALWPRPPGPDTAAGRAVLTRRIAIIPDVLEDVEYAARHVAQLSGSRSFLGVPLIRDGSPIGAIAVGRPEPGPIPHKQVALLQTFADQAVIAIENVRLFNETSRALEQQKALAEVLGAMSSSIADTKPVFDKILASCQRLFEGYLVGVTLVGADGGIYLGAYNGPRAEELLRIYPLPLSRESGSGAAILEGVVKHYPDSEADGVPPGVRRGCRAAGMRSIIFAPLLNEGRGIGALWVGRLTAGAFTDQQIGLLKTFADQAVIAIQNARLFREIQDKSREVEAANRHKSEFLANMSHELRTPLNAIIGFTRIVMRRAREQLEPKQYENLEKILASGQHLLGLINAILDLSKVEAGRIEIAAVETELAPVLDQCVRTVEPLVKSETVTLVKDFDSALPRLLVDEEKLRQIVINLLSNAAKFTARGSIRLQVRVADERVAIAVTDTGIGIAADKLEAVFEEFVQADAGSTRVYGGTGLGLTIARRLAHLMGGDIDVESTLGSGSTFTLTLPVRYHAAPA